MMMVRCCLGPSAIGGLGVFASVDIRKGQLVWLYDPRFDISYDLEEVRRAPKHFRDFIDRYTYPDPTDPERVVLDCDEGRFMNNADLPNIDLSGPDRGIAACGIAAGTELTICVEKRRQQGVLDPIFIRSQPKRAFDPIEAA